MTGRLHTCEKEFSRLCGDDETRAAIELHARLLRDPVQGRAEGYMLRTDYLNRLADTVYVELPGEADEARVLSILCENWTAFSIEAPDKIKWNPLPDDGAIHVFEFYSRRRRLH